MVITITYQIFCVCSNNNARQDSRRLVYFIIVKTIRNAKQYALYKTVNSKESISKMMSTIGKDTTPPTITVPNDMYVKLISSDEHEFYIKRDLALTSQTIKAMLSGPGLYYNRI